MAYYNKSPQNNGDGKNAEDRALDTFANMMILCLSLIHISEPTRPY